MKTHNLGISMVCLKAAIWCVLVFRCLSGDEIRSGLQNLHTSCLAHFSADFQVACWRLRHSLTLPRALGNPDVLRSQGEELIRIPMLVRTTFGPMRLLFLARFTRHEWLESKSVGSISGYWFGRNSSYNHRTINPGMQVFQVFWALYDLRRISNLRIFRAD